MMQMGNDIADRGKADARHLRSPGAVMQLVERAILRGRALRQELQRTLIGETPAITGDHHARLGLAPTHGEGGARVVERSSLVAETKDRAACQRRAADKLVADIALDGRAILKRNRRI